jgi:hypothetical protein
MKAAMDCETVFSAPRLTGAKFHEAQGLYG